MRRITLIVVLIIVAAWLGCNRQATLPDQSATLDNQKTTQEADKLLVANEPSEEQVSTAVEQVAVGDSVVRVPDSMLAVYSISMIWGQIPPDPLDTTPVFDWSGTAYVNGVGRFVVVCPIAFERGQDSLIPTNNPTSIAWHSLADSDVDGLATLLILRRDVQYVVEPHFVFNSGMASLDIPMSRMDKFDTVVIVNSKQALVVRSWRIVRPLCPSGTLTGDWTRLVNTGDSGAFLGTWNGPDGKPLGPLAGRFWTNPDGSREFAGAWSAGMLTVIAGEIKGKWSFADPSMCPICGVGAGEFHGKFVEVLGARRTGELHGVFGIGPGPGRTVMPFRGVWKVDCQTPKDQVN